MFFQPLIPTIFHEVLNFPKILQLPILFTPVNRGHNLRNTPTSNCLLFFPPPRPLFSPPSWPQTVCFLWSSAANWKLPLQPCSSEKKWKIRSQLGILSDLQRFGFQKMDSFNIAIKSSMLCKACSLRSEIPRSLLHFVCSRPQHILDLPCQVAINAIFHTSFFLPI